MTAPHLTKYMRDGVWFIHLRRQGLETFGTIAVRRCQPQNHMAPRTGRAKEVGAKFIAAMSFRHEQDEPNNRLGDWLAFRRLHQSKRGEFVTLGSVAYADSLDLAKAAFAIVDERITVRYAAGFGFGQIEPTIIKGCAEMVRKGYRITAPEEFTPQALGGKIRGIPDIRAVAASLPNSIALGGPPGD